MSGWRWPAPTTAITEVDGRGRQVSWRFSAGGSGLTSTAAKQLSHCRAIEQVQKSLELAAIVGGGVELEGKSASIKSISECIQSSNAISFSI